VRLVCPYQFIKAAPFYTKIAAGTVEITALHSIASQEPADDSLPLNSLVPDDIIKGISVGPIHRQNLRFKTYSTNYYQESTDLAIIHL
jgi:hypothetical protein